MAVLDAIRQRIPERWVKRWPTVRAVLVTYHVLALLVLSFPTPPSGMQRAAWQNPTVQNEFQLWSARISSLGVDMDAKKLDALLWDFSMKYVAGREKVAAPFEPYTRYSGARQSWRMFVAPQRFPIRIEILVRQPDKSWKKVYETRSKEHTWLAHLLEKYRLRRVVFSTAWDQENRHFKMLCDWLAVQAARDFPDGMELQVRQIRYRTPSPEEALAGKEMLETSTIAREIRKLSRPK